MAKRLKVPEQVAYDLNRSLLPECGHTSLIVSRLKNRKNHIYESVMARSVDELDQMNDFVYTQNNMMSCLKYVEDSEWNTLKRRIEGLDRLAETDKVYIYTDAPSVWVNTILDKGRIRHKFPIVVLSSSDAGVGVKAESVEIKRVCKVIEKDVISDSLVRFYDDSPVNIKSAMNNSSWKCILVSNKIEYNISTVSPRLRVIKTLDDFLE